MAKLKVKDTFSEALDKVMESTGDDLIKAFEAGERARERLEVAQRFFWVCKALEFYESFYNKGVNCESVSWTLLDAIVDWLYVNDPDIKEVIDEWYPPDCWHMKRYKKFKADRFFGDEMDVIQVRDLLEAARNSLETRMRELADEEEKEKEEE